MVYSKPLRVILVILGIMVALSGDILAQSSVLDTLFLETVPPDSVSVYKRGDDIVIRWYSPDDSISSGIGTMDFRSWYSGYDPADISQMNTHGDYTGSVDMNVRIEREVIGPLVPLVVGTDPFISLRVETIDAVNRSYSKTIRIGTDDYIPGELIPLILRNEEDAEDLLDLGFSISFTTGIIDSSLAGGGALIAMDLQDFEGFHVWRGLSPYPSEMISIVEISKEDYFDVSNIDVAGDVPLKWLWLWEYFRGTAEEDSWPRVDDEGREYYEWVDGDVYPGFDYYYHVTCYDRGFFKNFFQHNKEDNHICDEDLENPLDPGNVLDCEEVAQKITMTVDAGGDSDEEMMNVYAVPNPFRTGTSAQTSPAYHNYEPNAIKFFNVPENSKIRIYTVSGDLVWESNYSDDGIDGIMTWDVRNKEHNEVGSGVYIYKCESVAGGSVYGRIVVIR
ncbi:MAG: hypothetical protein KAV42_00390 [Candidatus Krumholzibacteria bacterium]|nr:hypothetical protein [Candidatus Krumholzibacteria bacterium]